MENNKDKQAADITKEHPLAKHPHAVKCDGAPGCYTVAPIRVLPDYSKRYCHDHLPAEEEAKRIRTQTRTKP